MNKYFVLAAINQAKAWKHQPKPKRRRKKL